MSLKRREFLLSGSAAVATPLIARTIGPLATGEPATGLASAKVIWCSAVPPVPIQSGGAAESIASSSGVHDRDAIPDLHGVFAKEFHLTDAPSRAVLHLFAFTRYRIYVNGSYVGRGPCRYQNQRPEYDSRSISEKLQAGRNTLVVLVHRDAPTGRIMRHDPGFVARLDMVVGGKRQMVPTDASWLSIPELSFGPRAQAWSSIEEHLDARMTGDWTSPDLTSPIWRPSLVVPGSDSLRFFPRSAPLQLETERPWDDGAPTLPLKLSTGSQIEWSLPEIAQAFHVLEMEADEGSTLEISYVLPGGEASGKCTYIARAGRQTWMGGDTFAFRTLDLHVTAGHVGLTRVAAYEVRYPFERVASFTCSDPMLTQLWSICARSLELLSEDSYVDCADRERVEWTDDSPPAFDCTRVMMRGPDSNGISYWGDNRLLLGLLRRIALTQQPDGQLKAHSCSERFDIHAIMEDRSCDWVILLREYFESSNDTALVEDLWPTLSRLIQWFLNHRTDRGLVQEREWEVWDNPLRYQVCEGTASNALVYRALADASYLAGAIGRQGDQRRLLEAGERLRAIMNSLLWNPEAGAYDGALFGPEAKTTDKFTGPIVEGRFHPTAQAQIFAHYCGVVPEDRLAAVRSWVLSHLSEVKEPMSHYYLFRMLYAVNDPEQDTRVLQMIRSGWKRQVDSPWQTAWEGLEDDGSSKAHMYGLVPGYFLSAYVLGVRRLGSIRDRAIVVEPRCGDLLHAEGRTVTEFGPVTIQWTRDPNETLHLTCVIPPNLSTTLRLHRHGPSAILSIDGQTRPTRTVGNWMETTLEAGPHTILYHPHG
jgi:alpha-L-rhamnosidase